MLTDIIPNPFFTNDLEDCLHSGMIFTFNSPWNKEWNYNGLEKAIYIDFHKCNISSMHFNTHPSEAKT